MGNGEVCETNLVFLASERAELEAPAQTPLVVLSCCGKEQVQLVAMNAWLYLRVALKSTSSTCAEELSAFIRSWEKLIAHRPHLVRMRWTS